MQRFIIVCIGIDCILRGKTGGKLNPQMLQDTIWSEIWSECGRRGLATWKKTVEKVDTGYEENVYMTILREQMARLAGERCIDHIFVFNQLFLYVIISVVMGAPLRLIGFGILVHVVCEALKKIRIQFVQKRQNGTGDLVLLYLEFR